MAKKKEEPVLDAVVLDETPAVEEPRTEIVTEKGQMGWYKGRHYKVLNGTTGVGQWGDTGECFAVCDLMEEIKRKSK